MYMTTWKWILLRAIMTIPGRWGWFAKRFKRYMVYYTIQKRGEDKYVASSRFFTLDQLQNRGEKSETPPSSFEK